MTLDELERLERIELRRMNKRESRALIPVDSCSQLDTGYTGRPDTDIARQIAVERDKATEQKRWMQRTAAVQDACVTVSNPISAPDKNARLKGEPEATNA